LGLGPKGSECFLLKLTAGISQPNIAIYVSKHGACMKTRGFFAKSEELPFFAAETHRFGR
jgi:hypothetical protein